MPLDILFRILKWLPVASLLRLKGVSRDWLSLIQSSDFVYQHYHFTKHNNHRLILLTSPDECNNKQQVSLFSVENNSELLLDFPIIEDPFKFNPVEMVGSCHGIICLRQNRIVCLWNPATKQSTNLPPLPQVPIECHIGFGFDVKTNCYKVVCMNRNTKCTTHIYSLSSNFWRSIHGFLEDHLLDFRYAVKTLDVWYALKTPYRDSIYCWVLSPLDNPRCIILSFDCSNEVFKTIPLPDSIIQLPMALFILRENIASINKEGDYSHSLTDNSQRYEIWMLSDYNVNESWTKLYLIDPFSIYFHWMTWFSEDGDFILFLESNQLCQYAIVSQELKKLPAQVSYGFEVVTYAESLVSFERGSDASYGLSSAGQHAMMPINQSVTGNNNSWGDVDIPEVLAFKILICLPVVSLLRFKLVCKSWCSLIKSSEFISQHLHLHQNDDENIDLILHSRMACRDSMFEDSSYPSPATSYTCLLSTSKLELLDLPYRKSWESQTMRILASLDGIICLRVTSEIHVYLWNPATKQFRVVMAERTGLWEHEEARVFIVGFGFDVKTNNYKLVRFFKEMSITDVKVYSLCTGSWSCIHDEILPTVVSVSHKPTPYRKGINCWVALMDYDRRSFAILSFDFNNEVFGTIALPDSISIESSFVLKLAVLSENIACIALDENYFSKDAKDWHCEIWLMNEYGVKGSWTKLYTVGPFSQDWRLRTEYSKMNGDYILLQKEGQLYEYELVTQETKELPVQVQGPNDYKAVVYKESLVPIKSGSS